LAQAVATALANTSIDPSLLTLEITESVFPRDARRAAVALHELKAIGVKLALDDFGTGYSSLSHLDVMPIDIVKIDQSFVAKLSDQPHANELVKAIIELAHGLGMSVVAEGVETARQHHELTRLGSDRCQGFHFARPMPAAGLEPLIRIQADGSSPRLPIRHLASLVDAVPGR
jgi:EAL domain-containing protein (putative c-di-GMP-specific phosphodiesterase class I)